MNTYNTGEKIQNRYEVFKRIRGGMGNVYLCFDKEFKVPIAIKTILPEYLKKQKSKENFKKEALSWTYLERHNNIVCAEYVENIDEFPAIFMELIGGDNYYGNSLFDYLKRKYPFSIEEALKLSVQFCDGMLYAIGKFKELGKEFVHQDIKPSNILLTKDKCLKITDFGISKTSIDDNLYGGTLGYMSPEQFYKEAVDTRSDIYSFGCVLFELFCFGKKPYDINDKEVQNIHPEAQGMFIQSKHLKEKLTDPSRYIKDKKIKHPLSKIICKCLNKKKENRYDKFEELRYLLEALYYLLTKKKIVPVDGEKLQAVDWNNKGLSFGTLSMHEEELECYNKCLEIDKSYFLAWHNKAMVLGLLENNEEALKCYDKALEIEPEYYLSYNDKGSILLKLGLHDEALNAFNNALNINQKCSIAWANLGNTYQAMNKNKKALHYYHKSLQLYPSDSKTLYNKGISLLKIKKLKKAIEHWSEAIKINPLMYEAIYNKSLALIELNKKDEAIKNYDLIIEKFPEDARLWFNNGEINYKLNKHSLANYCFDKSIMFDENYSDVWLFKGCSLFKLGVIKEALICLNKSIEIDSSNHLAWYNKSVILNNYGKLSEAKECYEKALLLCPDLPKNLEFI